MQERTFPVSSLVDRVYHWLKQDLFEFRLLPGDRFTETEVSLRVKASRTPVREALMRLEREGYLQMKSRAGWQVRPFDFRFFQELYDLRTILETASLRKLSAMPPRSAVLALADVWCVTPDHRLEGAPRLSAADEEFHHTLVVEAGNGEVSRLHQEITERIRIVRRLDFNYHDRVSATYQEHQAILEELLAGRCDQACQRLEAHIASSRAAVENITLARIEAARMHRNGRPALRSGEDDS